MTNNRICGGCEKAFIPSSRHLLCPSCRSSKKTKHKCIECECLVHKDSERCSSCSAKKKSRNNNGSWKGGRTYTKSGYVMALAPDHPRSGSGRYVFEHILVMEEHLGRKLLNGETVHHKNGVKDDNRFENLELWRIPQPTGARVSDLVIWAKDLLKLYDPESLK